jgi:predicted ATPase
VVLVTGEPGIGKTALVTRFVETLGSDARVLWGTCDDLTIPRPLGPFRDLAVFGSSVPAEGFLAGPTFLPIPFHAPVGTEQEEEDLCGPGGQEHRCGRRTRVVPLNTCRSATDLPSSTTSGVALRRASRREVERRSGAQVAARP